MRVALYGRTPKQEDIIYVQSLISIIEQSHEYILIHEAFYEKIIDKIVFAKPVKCFKIKEELIKEADILLSLGRENKKLAVITYTNTACDEIKERVNFDDNFFMVVILERERCH